MWVKLNPNGMRSRGHAGALCRPKVHRMGRTCVACGRDPCKRCGSDTCCEPNGHMLALCVHAGLLTRSPEQGAHTLTHTLTHAADMAATGLLQESPTHAVDMVRFGVGMIRSAAQVRMRSNRCNQVHV